MPNTYTLISSNVLGSSAASVTFSSIPATFTDLVLKVSNRTNDTGVGNGFTLTYNGVSTNYSNTSIYGDGSTSASSRSSTAGMMWVNGSTETSNTFASVELYVPNYAGSTYKPSSNFAAMENNAAATTYIGAQARLWSNTAAITSMTLTPSVGSWVSGSSFYLYGIKNS
jgi:hypothetical protein